MFGLPVNRGQWGGWVVPRIGVVKVAMLKKQLQTAGKMESVSLVAFKVSQAEAEWLQRRLVNDRRVMGGLQRAFIYLTVFTTNRELKALQQ